MSAEVLAQQRQLYGEPIGDLVRRIGSALGLSQAAVARVIGMSPAMLSQLASGQRAKIGNPLVLGRFQALAELAVAPGLPEADIAARLEAIAASDATITSTLAAATGPDVVRRLLRAVASGRELEAAADALADLAPGIAEVLRVYGAGTADEASAHYRGIAHLLR